METSTVAAEPKNTPSNSPDAERQKMRRMLLIAGSVGVVVILVTVIASLSSGTPTPKMSDGSDGSVDDPNLKEVAVGVKIREIKEGSGQPCPTGAKVKIHYTGWLRDGTIFDTTKDRGPAEFKLTGLIAGWQIGIPGMKPGGIRKLVIAPEQGYGSRATGKIPPGSTLVFEVELLDFTPPKDLTKLSDGTAPGADDPGLKDIGGGLLIRDLKEGTGTPVPEGGSVTVHYTGWLPDGKVFDSSHREGEPVTFQLARVVQGWQKGIPGMKPGGIRKLVIPPALAYGAKGDPPTIPPNATLIFEVELIK
jgi:peptidylprolyl isomerase